MTDFQLRCICASILVSGLLSNPGTALYLYLHRIAKPLKSWRRSDDHRHHRGFAKAQKRREAALSGGAK